MELLVFGKNGWGDELFFATLMTLAVAITAMLIGFLFALIFTPLKISKNKILNFIEKNLPKYMLPSEVFIRESDFPRTQNGKINKKELIKDILKNIY